MVDAIDRMEKASAYAGFQTSRVEIDGAQTLVARTSEFRWSWFATKLHTFLVARAFPAEIALPGHLDAFMQGALRYAKANKPGLPVGLQTGIATIVTAVVEGASPSARRWAATPHGRQFGVISLPVLVDTATGDVVRPARMLIGGVYFGYLKEIVDRQILAAVGGHLAEA
ncbi:MAG TPA: hypothetical protein VIL48_05655 [Acidimicrobiales bacterium]